MGGEGRGCRPHRLCWGQWVTFALGLGAVWQGSLETLLGAGEGWGWGWEGWGLGAGVGGGGWMEANVFPFPLP